MVSVAIDHGVCVRCEFCIEVCPVNAISLRILENGEERIEVGEAECCACNACAIKCPHQAIQVTGYELLKVDPPAEYPPEQGRYLRGNDYSPVAVVAILDTADDKIPPEHTELLQTAVEAGAALAGSLQTENLGIEKIVANVVANPNIRYLIVCWREAQGHRPAEALRCLIEKGVAEDKRRTIIGATAPTPYLANISLTAIQRFRQQVSIVNLIREDDAPFGMRLENVRNAVRACIQERSTDFEGYSLFDPGAWPEPPICEPLTLRLKQPWRPNLSEDEKQTLEAMKRAAMKKQQSPPKINSVQKKQHHDDQLLLEFLGLKKRKKPLK